MHVDHEDDTYTVKLKKDGDTVKTLGFDNSGYCTNCLSDNFNDDGTGSGGTQGGTDNQLALLDFEWKGRDCTYPVYYTSTGPSGQDSLSIFCG